jgi:hypothetical protein
VNLDLKPCLYFRFLLGASGGLSRCFRTNAAQRCSARIEEQRGSLRGGAFKSQTFEGKKCVLNNAQRHSARTQKQRGSLRGGAFKSQKFEGKKFIE